MQLLHPSNNSYNLYAFLILQHNFLSVTDGETNSLDLVDLRFLFKLDLDRFG